MDNYTQTHLISKAIELEVKASIQYMWHHVLADVHINKYFKRKLKQIAIEEMRHAETLAEILVDVYHTQPPAIYPPTDMGKGDGERLILDVREEEKAIDLYDQILHQDLPANVRREIVKIQAQEKRHRALFLEIGNLGSM